MRLSVDRLELRLARPFGISRWTRTSVTNVRVELAGEGLTGRGEACPNARYGESPEQAITALQALVLPDGKAPDALLAWLDEEAPLLPPSARSGLEMALLDRWATAGGLPLYRAFGLEGPRGPRTSYTVGLDTPEAMAEHARAAASYPVLKLKLGTEADRERVNAIRAVTDRPLRVDVNEGWPSAERALAELEWLATQGVELVEQPIPAHRPEEMAWLKARSPLPLWADEEVTGLEDLPRVAEGYHGVNLKLDKHGGLGPTRGLLRRARELGLRVMVGCMVASSLAITAAAHLALEADLADLDGHLLLAEDPFEGVLLDHEGHLVLPGRPGLGVLPRRP